VRDELGFDFIQEVDFKQVYQACSVFCDMICPPGQARRKTTIACQTALSERGVAFSLCQPTFPRHPCATTSHFPVMLQIRLFGRATQSLRKSPTFFRRSFSSYCHPSQDAHPLAPLWLSLLLRWKSRPLGGRPQIEAGLRALIRRMSMDNPLWGAPRIHGELLKLGFEVAQSSVAKYMVKRRGPPSQGWRTFLRNHAPEAAAMDFFVVPTIGFDLLYAFIIVRIDRRDLVWVNVTKNPTAEWVARQITEAFPWDGAPGFMIRDRDRIYGGIVTRRLRAMGIRDKPTAPVSPWQNGFAERLIGSIRRECLDHIVVFGEAHLRRILRFYASYYNKVRTHRSLDKDAPVSRSVQRTGSIKSFPILGGLHHRYSRV
jgi:transposase InsO family protein